MEITLPYGGHLIKFDIPNLAGRFRCHFPKPLSAEQIKSRLEEGLNPYLNVFNKGKILTIVNDATRRTPTEALLHFVWDYIKGGHFIVATGTHRQPLVDELLGVFGQYLPDVTPQLLTHDCYAHLMMAELGKTSFGTPVKLNRALIEADTIFTINSVEPHFFAGFTGGRKSIVPGLASFETIRANHHLAKDINAVSLSLENNPLNADLEEAVSLLKDKALITIQCVTDRDGAIIDIYAGELRESFAEACITAGQYYTVETPRKYDIVIANCEPPLDINLYQLQKAQDQGGEVVRDGGVLIVMGACVEGIGSKYFMETAAKYPTPQDVLLKADHDDSFGMHKLVKTARQLEKFHVYYVTTLDENIVRKVYFEAFNDIQTALANAYTLLGKRAEVAVIDDAAFTVPLPKQ